MTGMPRPRREDFTTDNAYYDQLDDWYTSDEGMAEVLASPIPAGESHRGAEAAAIGRKMLLSAAGLPETSEISFEELSALLLAEQEPKN